MSSAQIIVDGQITYNFDTIMMFWMGSVAIMTLLVVPTLWAKKVKKDEPAA